MVPQLIDPTHLNHPLCTISALYNPLDPLWCNLIPYNYAKSTWIVMNLDT